MRTTVDIEAGLLKRLRIAARRKGVSVKEYLAVVLERGFEEQPARRGRFHVPTFSMGRPRPSINLEKALNLAGDMEDEETARELTLRK
ncbi:MAG TPA: hypothetical protein VES88_01500 [Gemmatimonadaceae bacterium]|nr:hypothetical protein [Gemmatimonadaceae bacterium]